MARVCGHGRTRQRHRPHTDAAAPCNRRRFVVWCLGVWGVVRKGSQDHKRPGVPGRQDGALTGPRPWATDASVRVGGGADRPRVRPRGGHGDRKNPPLPAAGGPCRPNRLVRASVGLTMTHSERCRLSSSPPAAEYAPGLVFPLQGPFSHQGAGGAPDPPPLRTRSLPTDSYSTHHPPQPARDESAAQAMDTQRPRGPTILPIIVFMYGYSASSCAGAARAWEHQLLWLLYSSRCGHWTEGAVGAVLVRPVVDVRPLHVGLSREHPHAGTPTRLPALGRTRPLGGAPTWRDAHWRARGLPGWARRWVPPLHVLGRRIQRGRPRAPRGQDRGHLHGGAWPSCAGAGASPPKEPDRRRRASA